MQQLELMRIVGYRFHEALGPLSTGSVPLSSFTVLLGANDVGKSSFLATFARDLQAMQWPPADENNTDESGTLPWDEPPTLFLELSQGAFELVVADALARAEVPAEGAGLPAQQRLLTKGGEELLAAVGRDVVPRLTHSRIVSARPCRRLDEGLFMWDVTWCIEPDASGDAIPVEALYVGETLLIVPPHPIALPLAPEDVMEQIGQAASMAVQHVYDEPPAVQPGDLPDMPAGMTAGDAHAKLSGRSADRVSADYSAALQFAVAAADDAMSAAIGRVYALRLSSEGELLVEDRRSGDTFPADAIAEGHQLWLQLAILDGAAAMRRFGHQIYISYISAMGSLLMQEGSAQFADYLTKVGDFETAWARYQALVTALRQGLRPDRNPGPSMDTVTFLATEVENLVGRHEESVSGTLRVFSPMMARSIYLIDEPEQHLHPARQREVAQWVFDTLRQQESQAVLTTHSPTFLNFPADTVHIHVQRAASVTFTTYQVAELRAVDNVARELGFDRGELLAAFNVILFVEGRADQAVLESLIGPELHAIGVLVVPSHGASRLEGIATAETVARFTTAKLAALYDNVAPEVIASL